MVQQHVQFYVHDSCLLQLTLAQPTGQREKHADLLRVLSPLVISTPFLFGGALERRDPRGVSEENIREDRGEEGEGPRGVGHSGEGEEGWARLENDFAEVAGGQPS